MQHRSRLDRLKELLAQLNIVSAELSCMIDDLSQSMNGLRLPRERGEGKVLLNGDHESTVSSIPLSADGAEGVTVSSVCHRLATFWERARLGPVMRFGDHEVDLSTGQGRWELLVIAILIGARVRPNVAATTFGVLKTEGLLTRHALLGVSEEGEASTGGVIDDVQPDETVIQRTKERVHGVFRAHYRALGDRRAKAEALFHNRWWLEKRWRGDLHRIYEAAAGDGDEIEKHLRAFNQVGQVAKWICRQLFLHDVWPLLTGEATWYFDRDVHLPLTRLGILKTSGREALQTQTKAVVQQYFDGSVLPLYLQGSTLCSADDAETCLTECPVAGWCSFPRSSPSR